jgi:hypothetical protein
MDLQTRKLNIIEYLIKLKDEKIFKVIEDVIHQSKTGKEQSHRPFTRHELIERAKKSNKDYIAGNFIDQEQLEIKSKTW